MTEHEGWHEITVATPLPMSVAGILMQLIGAAWPEAIIRPTKKVRFGVEPVFTMLVPPVSPQEVTPEEAQDIRAGAEEAAFTGFRLDDENHAWVGTAPPEELTLFLGEMAHRIFAEMGGINYVEWQVRSRTGAFTGHYTLTVTKEGGKTPHTLRKEAEEERDELRAAIQHIVDNWESGDLAGAINEAASLLPEEG